MTPFEVYRLLNRVQRERQIGRTTVMAALANQLDGVLVCRNTAEASRVKHEFGCNAVSASSNLDAVTKPLVVDPDTLELAAWVLRNEVHKTADELEKAKEKLKRILGIVKEMG